MTTNPETPRLVIAGNGTRGPFPLSVGGTPITYADSAELVFNRYDDDDALVGALVEGVDYAVSADSRETGQAAATVTLDSTEAVLASGESIVLERVTAKSSSFSLASTGGIFEAAIDKIARLIQELWSGLQRRLEAHPLYTGSLVFPAASAGAFIGWNADEDGLTNLDGVADVSIASAMTAVVQSATRAIAAARLGVAQVINVKDPTYGALGDLQCFSTGAITASTATLTVTGASFTAADVGKAVWVQYAAGGSLPLVTTIAAVLSSTQVTLAAAADSSVGSLTSLEVAYGTDDTTAIKAAIAAANVSGATVYFPRGIYGWSDGLGMVLGNGSSSAPSTTQNLRLAGEAGGTGKLLTNNVQGSMIRWFGTGTGTYMVDAKGPIRILINDLVFDGVYRVTTGWNLKHVFNSSFERFSVIRMKVTGIKQGAYPTAVGIFTGCSANKFSHFHIDMSGVLASVGLDIGETAFVAGFDVSTNVYERGAVLVADDSGMTWPTATGNTSIGIALRFCDNLTFRDVFTYVASQRRGFGVRVIAPTGTGGAPYPTEIAFYNCPLIGGVTVDASSQIWTPDTNYGRGLNFYPLNVGDMMDPAYLGHASIPTSNAVHEGLGGATGDGVILDRFQQQMTRAGVTSYGVTLLDRDITFQQLDTSTTPTDVYSFSLPAYALRVFDRIANAYKNDRQLRLTVRGAYKNDTGGASNLTIKVFLGSTTVFNSGAISVAQNASYRTIGLDVRITAKSAANAQYMDGQLQIGLPGSGGSSTAALATIQPYTQNHTGLTEDLSTAKTLRVEVTHGTSDAAIIFGCNTVTLELL